MDEVLVWVKVKVSSYDYKIISNIENLSLMFNILEEVVL
jgi:hypothetical protein